MFFESQASKAAFTDGAAIELQSPIAEADRGNPAGAPVGTVAAGGVGGVLVVPLGSVRAIGGQQQASAQTAVDTQAAVARGW